MKINNLKCLSLFDGISGCQQALKNLGIEFDGVNNVYYASEVDKYAIQITQKNFPNTIQLGDVRKIKNESIIEESLEQTGIDMQGWAIGTPIYTLVGYELKGEKQSIYYKQDIDLLCGGSPCQDLSIAKKGRKGLDGERSGLFYEYVRILKEVKPKFFILENVASMSKESKELISKELFNIEPVLINSSLLVAQQRKRLYWISRRVDFCDECFNKQENINNINDYGTEEKRRVLQETQREGIQKVSREECEKDKNMQDMSKDIYTTGETWNNKDLLHRVPTNQQETKRQEQESRKEENIYARVSKEKHRKDVCLSERISREKQGNCCTMGEEEATNSSTENVLCNEGCLETEQQKNQFIRQSRFAEIMEQNGKGMCCLQKQDEFNSGPYNSNQQGRNKQYRESTTFVQELQFKKERQNNEGIFICCNGCGKQIPLTYKKVEIEQPQDKGILLKDILESGEGIEVINQGKEINKTIIKSHCLMARDYKGFGNQPMSAVAEPICVASRGRNIVDGKRCDIKGAKTEQRLEPNLNFKTNTLTSVQKDNLILQPIDKVKYEIIKKQYEKRINNIDIEFNKYLKERKTSSKKTIKEISDYCNESKTTIEHYFRLDSSRAIPNKEVYLKLKEIINLDNRFDKHINETEILQSTFEQNLRVYDINYKSPTLTSSGDIPIRLGHLNKGGQGDRIYSVEGKSVNLSANGGGRFAKTGGYLIPKNNGGNGEKDLTNKFNDILKLVKEVNL